MGERNTFAIGDTVEWTSQANGSVKRKSGKIVAIVPADTSVWRIIEEKDLHMRYNLRPLDGSAHGTRGHESYLVAVRGMTRAGKMSGHIRLYHPRVALLRSAYERE